MKLIFIKELRRAVSCFHERIVELSKSAADSHQKTQTVQQLLSEVTNLQQRFDFSSIWKVIKCPSKVRPLNSNIDNCTALK